MRVYLFCRFPEKGKVKSRLAAHCGESAALELYKKMLDIVIQNMQEGHSELKVFYTGCDERTAKKWLGTIESEQQSEGDLGERLQSAVERGFKKDSQPIVLIGADCPDIDKSLIDQVEHEIKSVDLVLGPATDGGYYLLALKEANAEIFTDIDWGTEKVLDQTLYACKREKLSVHLLEEKADYDLWEDLPEEWRRGIDL